LDKNEALLRSKEAELSEVRQSLATSGSSSSRPENAGPEAALAQKEAEIMSLKNEVR
jgi:hypothetical protein